MWCTTRDYISNSPSVFTAGSKNKNQYCTRTMFQPHFNRIPTLQKQEVRNQDQIKYQCGVCNKRIKRKKKQLNTGVNNDPNKLKERLKEMARGITGKTPRRTSTMWKRTTRQ